MSNDDNIETAVDKMAETMDLTRKPNTGSTPGEPAQKQVLIRATEVDHNRWKEVADKRGQSLSEFVRHVCNAEVEKELDCTHPAQFRKSYPWSEKCLKCGFRIR